MGTTTGVGTAGDRIGGFGCALRSVHAVHTHSRSRDRTPRPVAEAKGVPVSTVVREAIEMTAREAGVAVPATPRFSAAEKWQRLLEISATDVVGAGVRASAERVDAERPCQRHAASSLSKQQRPHGPRQPPVTPVHATARRRLELPSNWGLSAPWSAYLSGSAREGPPNL